jgi:predicted nucleotidyltransferase
MKKIFESRALADLCHRYHVRKLSLFGSVLTGRDLPESDVDLLVEFEPQHIPGLLVMARMERELANLLDGRRVDLRTPEDLSRYFRQDVLTRAEIQFAA